MFSDYAGLQFVQYLAVTEYMPLCVDRRSHKIVPSDQSKRTQAGWNLRPASNPDIHVVCIPILFGQSLVICCFNLPLEVLNPVVVLSGQVEPGRRIPIGTDTVFLIEKSSFFSQGSFCNPSVFALVNVAEFLFPLTLPVEEPIYDARIT